MQDQTKQISGDRERRLERALVSQILRDDRTDDWLLAALARELGEADPRAIGDALARLEQTGVVEIIGDNVRASRAAMRLDELELLAL